MKRTFILFLSLILLLCGCRGAAVQETAASTAPETTEATTQATEPVMESETTEETTEEITEETTAETTEPPTEPQPESFLLTFVGDCTLGSPFDHFSYPVAMVLTVGEDYSYPFRNVMEWFGNDDASFINLEGPLCEEGSRAAKQHVFRGPPEFVNILTESSVEAVTLANNHAYDFLQAGYDSTKALLTEVEVPYVEKDSSMIFTTDSGLTIGLYAVTYEHLDKEEIVTNISRLAADETVDLVIFVPHWGIENTYRQNQTQQDLAYAAIDAGAHIVWGSHTHVLQPIEAYGGGIIFYSLANFSFGGNAYPKDFDTALLQQEVIREPDGTVRLGELTIVPCSVSSEPYRNNFQPTPYEEGSEAYERVLQKLSGTFTGPDLGYN